MSQQRTIRRQKMAIFGLVVALLFTLTGFEIASAAVNNSDGTVNACYKTKGGNLSVQVSACKATETPLVLSTTVPMYAQVSATGVLGINKHVASVIHIGTGQYAVRFDAAVTSCAVSVTTHDNSAVPGVPRLTNAQYGSEFSQPATDVVVVIDDNTLKPVDTPFWVTVIC